MLFKFYIDLLFFFQNSIEPELNEKSWMKKVDLF